VDAETTPYTRAIFTLDCGVLIYDDIRQFGRITWSEEVPAHVARLGPDAMVISVEEFVERIKARHSRIKALLLNQPVLSGMGNMYCGEALFRAGIDPRAQAARLSRPRLAKLYSEMRGVLGLAIASGGSSISDYVDTEGRKGSFQDSHLVYGKEGAACV